MQIKNFKLKIFYLWPIFTLLLLNIILFLANYKPATYLIGWDNLMPELNFGVNIQRSIFSAWQEYQGLGLLGGMGHASDLLRQLFLFLTSYFLPPASIRYFWTFLTLFIGGAGSYFLAKHILDRTNGQWSMVNCQLLALTAALFYTLNIATIQTYFVIFETFSAHFASLPWIILTTLIYIKKPNFKHFVLLFLVFLLSAPSFYVPTIFVVVVIAIAIILGVNFLFGSKKNVLKSALVIFAALFITNSYWLLPFSLYTIKNSHTNINAKIDQMDTETIYLQNKEFGNLIDVAKLKGFWFNTVDPDINGDTTYMLKPWRDQFNNIAVQTASLALFGVILVGLLYILKRQTNSEQRSFQIPIVALFLFSITMLATNTVPFSWIDELLRKLPLFSQIFRFPFTKFGILAALTYSILLAFGLAAALQGMKRIMNNERQIKVISLTSYSIILASILLIAAPAFMGNLFYNKEHLKIPNEYLQTFDYFKNQDQNARIANLPQPTFWGWTNYSWGYGGSGFLWYGIKQPILDRAFDVWSENSENYYYQMSDAIYSMNEKKLENVLNKYQISYVLLDKNVIYPSSPKSLMLNQTQELLTKIPGVALDRKFGNISIYKVALKDNPKSFVYTTQTANAQIPYWSTSDPAYANLGNYSQYPGVSIQYPVGSLFSQKPLKNPDYTISENSNSIVLKTNLNLSNKTTLNIPDYIDTEKVIPVLFYANTNDVGDVVISARISSPNILIDGKYVAGSSKEISLVTLPAEAVYPININVNGVSDINIANKNADNTLIGSSLLSTNQDNKILISGENINTLFSFPKTFVESFEIATKIPVEKGQHMLQINIPKIKDSYLSFQANGSEAKVSDCNDFRSGSINSFIDKGSIEITSKNDNACFAFNSENLTTDQGYAVFVDTQSISGRKFHFWVLNEDEAHTPLDIFLTKDKSAFILPSMQESGLGLSFHFENSSIGNEPTINTFNSLSVYPIPYKYITAISLGEVKKSSELNINQVESVGHPNESLYLVNLNDKRTANSEASTLVLSQSYDSGWHAYSCQLSIVNCQLFPFLFGRELKNHVKVNNWENGWILNESGIKNQESRIVIVYLPQYLEYTGFGLIIITIIFLVGYKATKRHRI